MNLQRLNELYDRKLSPEQADIESLRQLTTEYPYFSKPFVILARYYHLSSHYKFEDMLRKAAIRVSDRKALYDYIHGIEETVNEVETVQEEVQASVARPVNTLNEFLQAEPELLIQDTPSETDKIQVLEETAPEPEITLTEIKSAENETFLGTLSEIGIDEPDSELHTEKPFEFEFEGHFRTHGSAEEPDETDIIGEEIMTEFSFSREFNLTAAKNENSDPEIAELQETETEEVIPENTVISESKAETESDEEDEEEIDEVQSSPDLSLRKYPVYNVEEFLEEHETEEREAETTQETDSSDFLSWLSHPRSRTHTSEKEPIEQEPEEPLKPAAGKGMDLIERFIAINPQISRPKKEFFNPENMAKRSEIPDTELVSETLAEIYYQQGNYQMAISAYEKLSLQNPSKQAYFAGLIEKIKKESK